MKAAKRGGYFDCHKDCHAFIVAEIRNNIFLRPKYCLLTKSFVDVSKRGSFKYFKRKFVLKIRFYWLFLEGAVSTGI